MHANPSAQKLEPHLGLRLVLPALLRLLVVGLLAHLPERVEPFSALPRHRLLAEVRSLARQTFFFDLHVTIRLSVNKTRQCAKKTRRRKKDQSDMDPVVKDKKKTLATL